MPLGNIYRVGFGCCTTITFKQHPSLTKQNQVIIIDQTKTYKINVYFPGKLDPLTFKKVADYEKVEGHIVFKDFKGLERSYPSESTFIEEESSNVR